jgi:D-galactarolactone isomerase
VLGQAIGALKRRRWAARITRTSAFWRALAKANPERCVRASNWPHPNWNPAPSSAAMLDLLLEWTDDESTRVRILVDNPAALYGF